MCCCRSVATPLRLARSSLVRWRSGQYQWRRPRTRRRSSHACSRVSCRRLGMSPSSTRTTGSRPTMVGSKLDCARCADATAAPPRSAQLTPSCRTCAVATTNSPPTCQHPACPRRLHRTRALPLTRSLRHPRHATRLTRFGQRNRADGCDPAAHRQPQPRHRPLEAATAAAWPGRAQRLHPVLYSVAYVFRDDWRADLSSDW